MVVSTYLDNEFSVDVVRLVWLVGLPFAKLSQAQIELLPFSFYLVLSLVIWLVLHRLHLVLEPLHTAQKSISSFWSMENTL